MRSTQGTQLVLSAIEKDKERHSSKYHVRVEHCGNYYLVWHWSSEIAIGRRGEMPFAFNLHGWTSQTTLNLLSQLGFTLYSKRISYGEGWVNEKTGRINHDRASVMHILSNDRPLLGMDGLHPDYHAWYTIDGICLSESEKARYWN